MSYNGKKTAVAGDIFKKDIAREANFVEGWGA